MFKISVSLCLKTVLFTEITICLAHEVCQNDIVYIDATGHVTLESKGYKRLLLYMLCVFDTHMPLLPTAKNLSSSHIEESI